MWGTAIICGLPTEMPGLEKMEGTGIKSLVITGTLVTAKTVGGYIERMCSYLLGEGFDAAACAVLVEIETKAVNAGLITWEEVGQIEAKYYEI